MKKAGQQLVGIALVALTAAPAQGEDAPAPQTTMEEVSVTASRIARTTKTTPEAVSVVSKKRIERAKMNNIKEVLNNVPGVLIDSSGGGSSARVIIRGAGQKAPYAVREIAVIRDGVPMTDPDSFTRLDFIDTQDIEAIEVTKGPGSLFGAGSAGGTIQIISKSVFDTSSNRAQIARGDMQSNGQLHLRYSGWLNDSNAAAITFSRREEERDWQRWNKSESTQLSLKHGLMMSGGATWETELSFSRADRKSPGSMDKDQFEYFRRSGRQDDTESKFKHGSRESKIWFFNSKLEKQSGDFTFKPRVYANHWSHFHPVSGVINVAEDNLVIGTDLELEHRHSLVGQDALVAGITLRRDTSKGKKKFEYAEVDTGFGGRISQTLSDKMGDELSDEDTYNHLMGVFFQESLQPTEKWNVDVGLRVDRSAFHLIDHEDREYSYSTGTYVTGSGETDTYKNFTLWSPKFGVSYAVTKEWNLYGMVAQSDQVPSASEIASNTALKASTSRNYEVGVKGRGQRWSADLTFYHNPVTDEIISTLDGDGDTVYSNAGKTLKQGVELSLSREVVKDLTFGGAYTYTHHQFSSFEEVVNSVAEDRAGKFQPYIPTHKGSLFAEYRHDSGFSARVDSLSWGNYWMDNANTEEYGGYDFVTNISLGYKDGPHQFRMNAENIADQRYAMEVEKDTDGDVTYQAGAARTVMLSYSYHFEGDE